MFNTNVLSISIKTKEGFACLFDGEIKKNSACSLGNWGCFTRGYQGFFIMTDA